MVFLFTIIYSLHFINEVKCAKQILSNIFIYYLFVAKKVAKEKICWFKKKRCYAVEET